MPERKTYARRSDLHKKPNNNQNEQRQLKKDRKDHLEKEAVSKSNFSLFTLLLIVLIATAGSVLYTLHQQEVAAQENMRRLRRNYWHQSKQNKVKMG